MCAREPCSPGQEAAKCFLILHFPATKVKYLCATGALPCLLHTILWLCCSGGGLELQVLLNRKGKGWFVGWLAGFPPFLQIQEEILEVALVLCGLRRVGRKLLRRRPGDLVVSPYSVIILVHSTKSPGAFAAASSRVRNMSKLEIGPRSAHSLSC